MEAWLNCCLFIRLSKLFLHGDWNFRRTSMLPEPFNMKGNDRSHKEQEKCLTSGISTNNKATLDVYFSVLGLSVSIIFCDKTQFHIEKCKRLMLLYKVPEKL